MGPPAGSGSTSTASIDRSILESLLTRLQTIDQVAQATIRDERGHLEPSVTLKPAYYPRTVTEASPSVRRYTNDAFKIHYREVHQGDTWECRWDRHPNPHNTRDHFHPPPTAPTPGIDDAWTTDHREVHSSVLDGIEERIRTLWEE